MMQISHRMDTYGSEKHSRKAGRSLAVMIPLEIEKTNGDGDNDDD